MPAPTRRQLLAAAASLGIGTPSFHRAMAATTAKAAQLDLVTLDMVEDAEWVAGIELTDDERKQVAVRLTRELAAFTKLHKVRVGNDVPPALYFNADPGSEPPPNPRAGNAAARQLQVAKPDSDDDLAFLPLAHLADLIRTRKISSVELTKLYLARIKKYDPLLKCVVTITEELALKQAAEADKERAAGKSRGLLHGIPWVAKDLIAYPGYKTTWGAEEFKDQTVDEKATVAERLDEAGAVLVAKVSLGALAMGDQWFGGMTRNPWNPKQGSSGSSAGSAAAVAAGLAGFALGSETWGSIISPCIRCGVTGLRPTYGRVSRYGCMTLSWSMDKLGPIARTAEDCGYIFAAIHGADGKDPTAVNRPFRWPHPRPVEELRIGYFEKDADSEERKIFENLGAKLVPIELPDTLPVNALALILSVEASAAFDDLVYAGKLDAIGTNWPPIFRTGRFIPAVEYLRAQRVRTLLMREMAKVMEQADLYIGGDDSLLTNLTGHPTVVVPNGFRKGEGVDVPVGLTLTGRLWGEGELLTAAAAYQTATGRHLKRPNLNNAANE